MSAEKPICIGCQLELPADYAITCMTCEQPYCSKCGVFNYVPGEEPVYQDASSSQQQTVPAEDGFNVCTACLSGCFQLQHNLTFGVPDPDVQRPDAGDYNDEDDDSDDNSDDEDAPRHIPVPQPSHQQFTHPLYPNVASSPAIVAQPTLNPVFSSVVAEMHPSDVPPIADLKWSSVDHAYVPVSASSTSPDPSQSYTWTQSDPSHEDDTMVDIPAAISADVIASIPAN